MSLKGLKVGIPVEYFSEHLSPEVHEVWNEVANLLEADGAEVRQVITQDSRKTIYLSLQYSRQNLKTEISKMHKSILQ